MFLAHLESDFLQDHWSWYLRVIPSDCELFITLTCIISSMFSLFWYFYWVIQINLWSVLCSLSLRYSYHWWVILYLELKLCKVWHFAHTLIMHGLKSPKKLILCWCLTKTMSVVTTWDFSWILMVWISASIHLQINIIVIYWTSLYIFHVFIILLYGTNVQLAVGQITWKLGFSELPITGGNPTGTYFNCLFWVYFQRSEKGLVYIAMSQAVVASRLYYS